ncbi:homeobox-leucine zipper protein HOX16, partial [Striga asiatica]
TVVGIFGSVTVEFGSVGGGNPNFFFTSRSVGTKEGNRRKETAMATTDCQFDVVLFIFWRFLPFAFFVFIFDLSFWFGDVSSATLPEKKSLKLGNVFVCMMGFCICPLDSRLRCARASSARIAPDLHRITEPSEDRDKWISGMEERRRPFFNMVDFDEQLPEKKRRRTLSSYILKVGVRDVVWTLMSRVHLLEKNFEAENKIRVMKFDFEKHGITVTRQ